MPGLNSWFQRADAAFPKLRPSRWVPWILAVTLFVMFFRWFEYAQVYHPTRDLVAGVKILGPDAREVAFDSEPGLRLHAWYVPPPTNSDAPHRVVLICHGNGGNISHRFDLYDVLRSLGYGFLAFDYRGYGLSEGRPSEAGTYLDVQAAYRFLREQGWDPTAIIAFGESLGGAIATELAMRETVGALVLQSTFTSIPDIGAELFPWLPVRWLGTIRYDTISKLPRLRAPLLVLHGRADTLVRFHHGERLFSAAPEPKLLWEIAGDHNDGPHADVERYKQGWEKLKPWLKSGGRPGDKPSRS